MRTIRLPRIENRSECYFYIILLGKPAYAAPVPGADGFNISPYGRPRMRSQPSSAGDSTGPKPFSGRTAQSN